VFQGVVFDDGLAGIGLDPTFFPIVGIGFNLFSAGHGLLPEVLSLERRALGDSINVWIDCLI